MADDDNKIVIDMIVNTDDAQKTIDDFTSTTSDAIDKLFGTNSLGGDFGSNVPPPGGAPFKDNLGENSELDAIDATKAGGSSNDSGLNESASKLSESADKLSEAASDLKKVTDTKDPTSPAHKSIDTSDFGKDQRATATNVSKYPAPTADDTPEAAVAASVQRSIDAAAKRTNQTSEEFKQKHDELNRDASGGSFIQQELRRALASIADSSNTDNSARGVTAPRGAGSEEVSQATGSRSTRESKAPPNLEQLAFGETNAEIGKSAEAVRVFREALHVFHPAAEEAGISLSTMTGLIRASTGGVVALGAALAGVLLVGLAKIGEEADRAKRRLDVLTGAGKEGGESVAGRVREVADKLNIAPENIQTSAEALIIAQRRTAAQDRNVIHPPGFVAGANEAAAANVGNLGGGATPPLSNDTIIKLLETIVEAGRIDKTKTGQADKAFSDFFESANKGKGLVTVESLEQLQKASPALAEAITKGAGGSGPGGLGQNFENVFAYERFIKEGGRPQTGAEAALGLARVAPEVKAESDKVPVDFSRAVEASGAKIHSFGEELANATLRLAKFLNQTPSEALKSTSETNPNLGKLLHGDFSNAYAPEPKSSPHEPKPESTGVFSNLNRLLHGDLSNAYAPEPTLTTAVTSPAPQAPAQAPPAPPAPIGFIPHDAVDQETRDRAQEIHNNRQVPVSTPAPAPATEQHSEAVPAASAQPNQQVADLGVFEQIVRKINAAINDINPKDTTVTDPVAIGIRGEGEAAQPQGPTSQLAALGEAAAQATRNLLAVPTPSTEQPKVTAAEGGHIRGPGTATSDSIPAMLSDGEYVLRAAAVDKIGVDKLDKVNVDGDVSHFADGGKVIKSLADTANMIVAHFADGGSAVSANSTQLPPGQHDIVDDGAGGAIIDGVEYPSGATILQDPQVQKVLKQSNQNKSPQKHKHHSQFNDEDETQARDNAFAGGGLIRHFAEGGLALRVPSAFQHFNVGGIAVRAARSTTPVIGLASGGVARDAPAATATEMPHLGRIDLTTNHGDFKMFTERDTMRHLSSAAQSAKRFSTGSQPSWYGGGQ